MRRPYFSKGVPIKLKFLIVLLPIIVISVVLSGVFSYWLAEGQIRENTNLMLNDTVYQTGTYIDDKMTTMFEQLLYMEDDKAIRNSVLKRGKETNKERLFDVIDFNNKMNDIYAKYSRILDSIYVRLNNGREFQLQKEQIPQKIGLNLNEWLGKYNDADKGYYWLNDHEDRVFETAIQRNVMTVFKMIGKQDSEFNGVVLINLKTEYFLEILNNVKISSNGVMVLLSPDGLLYSKEVDSVYEIGEKGIAYLRENSGNSGSFNIVTPRNKKMFVVYNFIKINNWTIAAIIPEADLLEKASQIKYISMLIIVFVAIVSALAVMIFTGRISKSIIYLSNQVKKVEQGNFNIGFSVKDKNEIGSLADGLTSLVKTVRKLLQQIRADQEKKRKLELLVHQSQINPHFLYNTLASIQQLIDHRDHRNAGTMLKAMTGFFKVGISKGKNMIQVSEEINHIRDYLIIQKMRYNDEFEFEFDIGEEIANGYIMKLILQPIVENSIYHGIKNKYEHGLIRISGRTSGPNMILEVFDEGAGIPKEKLDRLMRSINQPDIEQHPITFGLKNVNQRIKLYYGQQYGIEIESRIYEYTKVTVTIPLLKHLPEEADYA